VLLSGSAHSEAVVWEVMKASEVVMPEVMEMGEVVMVPEVMEMCEVVVVSEVMKVIHRVGGQRHRRGKHRHHDNASNSHFAEHDNPPGCPPMPSENATERKMFE
jgi:hypothetical protein